MNFVVDQTSTNKSYRYEQFERVDMGDFNWISPHFLAFASPQHTPITTIHPGTPEWSLLPKTVAEVKQSKTIPKPFKNVLTHFSTRNIGLVVRLNSQLYSSSHFTALGIQHLDMIFDDGTCPPLSLVRKFVNLAHNMITVQKKGIAVHCKAGLGRTGCLIGAYLLYRYSFTANEIIAYMRFMRPGMVVGPQQHWLHLNQHTFRQWWHEDLAKESMALQPSTPTRVRSRLVSNGQTYTPPNGSAKRAALGEITINEESTTRSGTTVKEEYLPAPTPGQPRKTSKVYGANSARYRASPENEHYIRPDAEVVSSSTHRQLARDGDESEEEYQMRMLARRASRSPVSRSAEKRRAVSCTTSTTVTTTKWEVGAGDSAGSDVENKGSPKRVSSGKGEIAVTKVRASPIRRSTTETKVLGTMGVRKTSGRVGSMGTVKAAK